VSEQPTQAGWWWAEVNFGFTKAEQMILEVHVNNGFLFCRSKHGTMMVHDDAITWLCPIPDAESLMKQAEELKKLQADNATFRATFATHEQDMADFEARCKELDAANEELKTLRAGIDAVDRVWDLSAYLNDPDFLPHTEYKIIAAAIALRKAGKP